MYIAGYRKKYGLSREALGKLAGCSGELIYILEHGGITHPGIADRITSVCGGGKKERNSIVDGAHWRAGWKQILKYRARGEKAEKAYFLRLTREKMEAERGQAPNACRPPMREAEHKGAKGAEGQRTYAIDRNGQVIGQYADCAAAAREYVMQRRAVENRCEHRIGNTNEYSAAGVTFRYAAEWDNLSDDERLKRAVDAAGTTWSRAAKIDREYTWQGQTHSVKEWAKIAGMRPETLKHRLSTGWDMEKALKTPVMSRQK